MRQIKLKKTTEYGKKGSVVQVSNNIAHTLIDKGIGEIYKPKRGKYKNTMMTSRRKVNK